MTRTYELDSHLLQLAISEQRQPPRSQERQLALTKLVNAIVRAGKLCRPQKSQFPTGAYEDIYNEARQELFLYICQNIDKYDPELASVMTWVNVLLDLHLSQLSSLENLLIHLNQLTKSLRHEGAIKVKQPIHLSQWFMNILDAGWQNIELLLNPQQQIEFGLKFRGTEQSSLHPENSTSGVQKGKLVDLGRDSKSQPIALVVGLIPASSEEINISIKVYSIGSQNYLPAELELIILDDAGISVMQATARKTKSIQLNFNSEIGECFSVKINLNEVSFTEVFLT